ncbi:hypothetical protein ABK040_007849 [Willaertia magna]
MSQTQHIKNFQTLLKEGGLTLSSPNNNNKSSSTNNQPLRVKDAMQLRRHIEKNVKTKQEAEDFCFSLKSMIDKDETFLLQCLLPFETIDNNNAYFSSNESFFKMLLNITSLQSQIFDILFADLITRCQDYDEDNYGSWDRNIPKLIVSQMRWLDMIVDSKSLANHLSSILTVSSSIFKKEMISAIPEIIDDSEHERIVDILQQVMREDNDSIINVVDALSNLNLKKEIMENMISHVLETLDSANTNDLPVIIRFLLQSANEVNVNNIVSKIREGLDISSLSVVPNDDDEDNHTFSQRKDKGKSSENNNCESLIVSALGTGIRHKKIIEKHFIQVISKVNTPAEHNIIDIWVLMAIYSMPNYRRDAELLLKKKIKNHLIDDELMKSSIDVHGEALLQFFPSMNELASVLLRNTTDSISQFGQNLYYYMFSGFNSDYNRQKIIASLITHVGSSTKSEKEAALDVLLRIAKSKLYIMRSYSGFIQGLLDYLTNLTDSQLRKVYKLFSLLSYMKTLRDTEQSSAATKTIRDELMIIIRKQLSNTNTVYKKMGIIGACSIISMIGSMSEDISFIASQHTEQKLTEEEYEEARDILHFASKCCLRVPIFKTLLYDELSYIVLERNLDSRLLQEIQHGILTDFFQKFIIESNELKDLKPHSYISYNVWMKLESEDESNNLIKIAPLIDNKNEELGSCESLWNLFAQFKLLKILMEKTSSGTISTLLDSGIVMFDDQILERFSQLSKRDKDVTCLSLFFTINWFRELINGFATSSDFQSIGSVIKRIEHLVDIEKKLDKCLFENSTFSLPQFNYLLLSEVGPVSQSKKKDDKKPKKKKTTKKKKNDSDEEEESEIEEEQEEVEEEDTKRKGNKGYVPDFKRKYLSKFKPYYRELDVDVMDILSFTQSLTSQIDNSTVRLEPIHLYYILDDVNNKLKSVIARTKATFFATKDYQFNLARCPTSEFFEKLINSFPSLCKHIERIVAGFRETETSQEEDEKEDELCKYMYIGPCLQLLIDIITKTLNHFSSDKVQFEKVVRTLLMPSKDDSQLEDLPIDEACERAFANFKAILSDVQVFETCSKIFELLKSIETTSQNETLCKEIYEVSEQLLKRPFGKVKPDIGNIISVYVSKSNNLSATQKLLENIKLKLESKTIDFEYPTIQDTNIYIFFKRILIELSQSLSAINLLEKDEKYIRNSLTTIFTCVKYFSDLVLLSKQKPNSQAIQATLIGSHQFITNFLKFSRYFAKHFKTSKERVSSIFNKLSLGTKQLDRICQDTKLTLNKTLAKVIPKVKKQLESVNGKVKIIFQHHNNALTIGTLNDRTITGEMVENDDHYAGLLDDGKRRRKQKEETEEEIPEEEEEESEKPTKKKSTKKNTSKKRKKDEENEEEQPEKEVEKEKKKIKKTSKKKKDEEKEETENPKKKKKNNKKDEEEIQVSDKTKKKTAESSKSKDKTSASTNASKSTKKKSKTIEEEPSETSSKKDKTTKDKQPSKKDKDKEKEKQKESSPSKKKVSTPEKESKKGNDKEKEDEKLLQFDDFDNDVIPNVPEEQSLAPSSPDLGLTLKKTKQNSIEKKRKKNEEEDDEDEEELEDDYSDLVGFIVDDSEAEEEDKKFKKKRKKEIVDDDEEDDYSRNSGFDVTKSLHDELLSDEAEEGEPSTEEEDNFYQASESF